jgi:hypothetical protein
MPTSILLLISFFAEVYMDNSFIYLPKLYSSKVHKISFDAGVHKFENITRGIHAWDEVYIEGSRAEQIDYFGKFEKSQNGKKRL